jgi:hypothetical protein
VFSVFHQVLGRKSFCFSDVVVSHEARSRSGLILSWDALP